MKQKIGEYQEYEKKKKLYRKVINRGANDWNDEPEYIAIPYTIWGEKTKSFVVTRAGWDSKKQRHLLPKKEFFKTKYEAMKSKCKWEDDT